MVVEVWPILVWPVVRRSAPHDENENRTTKRATKQQQTNQKHFSQNDENENVHD